jgi:hypothetical protein
MQANVGQATAPHAAVAALAGFGQRWREVERVMGIEPTGSSFKFSQLQRILGRACDFRVNLWSHRPVALIVNDWQSIALII